MIHALNHFTIITEDLPGTLAFYAALGLEPGPRPDLGFAGAWLYAGTQAVLHVYADRPVPPGRSGVIDHVALTASGLGEVTRKLDAAGIRYQLKRQAGAGTWQLFCHDPNGARVELDFAAEEER